MKPISLLYHDVVAGSASATGFTGADAEVYKLDEANFAAHLDRIDEVDACPRRVQIVTPRLADSDYSIQTPLFLTFDDGGVSAATVAAPLLEARGWRGHFFVVTEMIDQPGFLTGSQIRDLHRRGHHIGSHSHTHPARFSKLSYDRMRSEWRESRGILADILGEPPFSVSVPGGFYSTAVAAAAREAGYNVLFNSEPSCRIRQRGGLLVLGRYGIKRETLPETAARLVRCDVGPRLRQTLTWNLKKPLKKFGGPAWLAFRRWFFRIQTGSF
jgi:peptidoglycan/xylan/chitin deacetylase (PgdA/CDA1 family)